MDREVNFWGRIVSALWAPDRLLNRVENGVLDGMPDAYIVIDGSMNWIELKCPVEPKRGSTALFSGAHKLSIAQRNWLLSHRQAGGRGWVAIETDSTVMLVRAMHAELVNTSTLEQLLRLSSFWAARPLKEGDWIRFMAALTNGGTTPCARQAECNGCSKTSTTSRTSSTQHA